MFADQTGPFGSTTSDSERTMVRLETTRIMMVIILFPGTAGMTEGLDRAVGLLERYATASGIRPGWWREFCLRPRISLDQQHPLPGRATDAFSNEMPRRVTARVPLHSRVRAPARPE